MKKLYFFFVMLLSLCGATTAFAQDEVTIPVNMDNGKWISWNGNESNPWARTWFSTTTPAISICTATGSQSAANYVEDIRGKKFYAANNMSAWGDAKKDIMFFTRFGSSDAPYEITVAEGWYLTGVEFDFDCANNKNESDGSLSLSIDGGEPITSTDMGDIQHVSWTNDNEDVYSVQFLLTRIEGTYNFARTSNFMVYVKKLRESVAALQELQATLAAYEEYKGTFNPGTMPGLYGPEEVAAFEAAIDEAHATEDNPDLDSMPDDELAALYRSLTEKIKETYEAVLASKVPMTLADGYYRIKSGLAFYQTETVTDPETMEENTTTVYYDKYLSTQANGTIISAVWNTPEDVANHCPSLFKVTNKDGYFDIVSAATGGRFNNDKPVTLTVNSDNLMDLDAVTTNEEGVTYVNIRQSTAKAGSGEIYLHCGGHSSGKGVSGTLTLWYSTYANETAGASEWVFVPVNAEEAEAIIEAYGPIAEQEMLIYNFTTTMADAKAKMEIARDISIIIDSEKPLITDNSQFSSPSTESSEGSIDNLIDNNASTYWHSAWSGGNVANGTHYLQVEINDADVNAVSNAAIKITRRPVANDHITLWGVFGTNDPEAEKAVCEDLGQIATPFGNNTETIVSDVFSTKGYKYLRFYIDGTTTGRGYGHVSEFQIYPAEVYQSATAQSIVMGEVFTNLEAQVNALNDVEADDVSLEQYRELKAAYDAFIAVFVDPTVLREALESLKDVSSIIVIGNQPGFWSADTNVGAFKTLYEEAVAYDQAGAYTEEKSQGYIENLNKQSEDIYASANKVQTGKWYRIRFASEEEFDNYGWDKVAGEAQVTGGIQTSAELFGKYIAAAEISSETKSYEDEESTSHDVTVYTVKTEDGADVLGLGDRLYFVAKDEIANDDDLDLFRFIAVGDSAYLLQNKGTNLFLKAAGGSGAVSLSVHPSLFNVRAIGYGENVIAAKSFTGENQNYLHGQVAANMLVTWNAYTPGSRSGFYIEEAGDVTSDYEGKDFNMPILYGALNTFCYPMELAAKEGQMWSVNGVDMENNSITLVKIQKAVGGRPFIYINGETTDYDPEEENEMVTFTHGYSIDGIEPQTSSFLKGTYSSIVIDRGDIYCSGNEFKVNTVEKDAIMVELTRVGANHAYISAETPFSTTEGLNVIWDENTPDAIQTALVNVSRSGALYTIDGRLVSKKATLNDIQKFGKGLYILNGTKVLVK